MLKLTLTNGYNPGGPGHIPPIGPCQRLVIIPIH